MELLSKLMDFLHHFGPYFAVLFAMSEALAAIPSVASSAVYQVVMKGLKFLKDKFSK